MYKMFVEFVRDIYRSNDFIPLHEPRFIGREKDYLLDTIDSTFVSSVGRYVDEFEVEVAKYTGAAYAISTVNGTSSLHIALKLAGVEANTEVLTQSLTFVATCNAIRYCGAEPVFVDVSLSTLGLSSTSLEACLNEFAEIRDDGVCWNKLTNRKIVACMPVHTFGFPVDLDEIQAVCQRYNINLIEDAAESLGSFYKDKHTGNKGLLSGISFNGNKIITTGGGGMILTNDASLARKAKHLTTTAKLSHPWKFVHDEIGFNYRLPNLNAALGVAQIQMLTEFVDSKRALAKKYHDWAFRHGVNVVKESEHSCSNYWLNSIILDDEMQKEEFLQYTNNHNVMTRPVWEPMHMLEFNKCCMRTSLKNTEWLSNRLVNIPSSVVVG